MTRGMACSRPRVARLMKQAGLQAKRQKLFKRTIRVEYRHPAVPNLLGQNVRASRPTEKWVADIIL